MICSIVCFVFAASFLFVLGFFSSGEQQHRLWLHDLRTGDSRWEDDSLTMAAPGAWLGWTLLSLFAFLISYILAIHQFSANIDAKFSPRQSAAAIVFLAGVLLIGAIHFVVSHIHLYRLRARADHANVIVPLAQM